MKTILLAACGLCAIAGPALADELSIRDFVGRIEVVTGDYERIEVRVFDGPAAPSPEVRRSGADVEIVGDWDRSAWFRNNGLSCYGDGADLEARLGRGERRPVSDFPLIQVTAPRGVTVDVDGVILVGGMGDIGGGEIGHAGCGDLTIESVTGDLRAAVAGSGRIAIGDIGGSLFANIAGSGLVRTGDIAGDVDGSIAGSGDVEMGRVGGDMELSIAGSGAFRAAAANGNIDANIAGSGDMDIGGGNAGEVRVRIMGSGNFAFAGEAARARVNTAGSGDVEITRAADADVHVAGSGDVHVNGVRMR